MNYNYSCFFTFSLFILLFIPFWGYNQVPGSLDSTYGNNGIVTTPLASNAEVSLSISTLGVNNKITIAMSYRPLGNSQILVARYLENGSLDTTWGQNGITFSNVGTSMMASSPRGTKLQSDGKLLIVGIRDTSPPSGSPLIVPFILRFNTDGLLDTSFGTNGMVLPHYRSNTFFRQVTVQNNRILVFGNTSDSSLTRVQAYHISDGTLDTTWGNQGELTYTLVTQNEQRIASLSNQKILLFLAPGHIYCFNPDGSIDSTFGANNLGYVETQVPKNALGLVTAAPEIIVQSDQKILVGGATEFGNLLEDKSTIERYYPNGLLDTSFADSGVLVVDFGFSNGTFEDGGSALTSIGVQSDGAIIASGHVVNYGGSQYSAIARYDSTGDIDSTFGNNGVVVIDLHPNDSIEFTFNVHVQPDNKIVQTGFTRLYSQVISGLPPNSINLVRYHGDSVITSTTQAPPTPQSRLDFFPNPAKEQLNANFTLAESGQMELSLYDVQGRKVQTLLQGERGAGDYQETFQLDSSLPAGVYVLKLETEHSYFAKILVIQ